MRTLDIRERMLLAALLPVVLISTLLALVFLLAWFDDMQVSYHQRTRSVARQLALASEYGLFSANQVQLQAVVRGALREPDLRWVAVFDSRGQILVSSGETGGTHSLTFSAQEAQSYDSKDQADWLTQPVFASSVELDDLFVDAASQTAPVPVQLGQVRLKFSRQSIDSRKHNMLLLGCAIGAVGLLFGMMLAAYLSRGVIRPIMRVTTLIERIGRGDYAEAREARALVEAGDPLYDLQNNLYRMADRLASARDDLEQKIILATLSLREKKDEAELANRSKSHFLAVASHDLRQPIHALGMFVTRLAQLPHDPQTEQLIGNLEASVLAMQNLLDGLLDISRLDAQAVQFTKRPFALSSLFARLEQDMGQTALDRGLRLRIRPSSLWVMSDATLIYRILLNLVGNALRYTERGGVLVAARVVPGKELVQLQVWDSGIGIAPEHQSAVFTEFYQVANPARDRSRGMGLGLNIVQRTAALLGHPVALSSRLGFGSRFTVTLPVVAAQLGEFDVEPVEKTSRNDLLGVQVLVIEDDDLVRHALVGLLGDWGLQVLDAQGMHDAKSLLAHSLMPALIISDYRLKDGHNGIEVVQALRIQLGQSIPACLMSGDSDSALIRAAQAANLTLLHKPVRPAKLRNLVRRLLLDQGIGVDDLV